MRILNLLMHNLGREHLQTLHQGGGGQKILTFINDTMRECGRWGCGEKRVLVGEGWVVVVRSVPREITGAGLTGHWQ